MIMFHGKQVVSVVTAMLAFDLGEKSSHQFSSNIPTALFPQKQNRDILWNRYISFEKESNEIHRSYRQSFITSLLEILTQDCELVDQEVIDSVTKNLQQPESNKCFFSYTRVPEVERRTPVIDLDCLNINPNSYDNVAKVLDSILDSSAQTGRKYIVTIMDGSPFSMAIRIIRDTMICQSCTSSVMREEIDAHKENCTNSNEFHRKYKKIVIRPGEGHVELTIVRAILSFFWTPFIKPIAREMGYSTENALLYAKKGYDHHKSYNLLM